MFDLSLYLIPTFAVLVFASVGWRYFRYGSWAGVVLRGRIDGPGGEIVVRKSLTRHVAVKVGVLRKDQEREPLVALSVVQKAPLALSISPVGLTKEQARELSDRLLRATNESS